MPLVSRISLRQLFLWLSVYALLFACVAGLPVTSLQVGAAIAVLTAFVVVDSQLTCKDSGSPRLARVAMVIAFYATAFAAAVAVCFLLYEVLPPPPAPPPAPHSLFESVLVIVSGQLFEEIGNAIGDAIAIQMTYYTLFSAFSLAGFLASMLAMRHFRSARWLAFLDTPGTCLGIFLIGVSL